MATETLLPNATASTGFNSFLISIVDEGVDNADNTWATADSSGATTFRASFPTPSPTLTLGANLQTFRARVRKNATGGNNPTVQIVVYELGTSTGISSNDITITTTGTGQTITFTWDATILALQSGADAELAVIQTGGASGRATNRRYIEVDTVDWIADYTTPVAGGGAYSFSTFF